MKISIINTLNSVLHMGGWQWQRKNCNF